MKAGNLEQNAKFVLIMLLKKEMLIENIIKITRMSYLKKQKFSGLITRMFYQLRVKNIIRLIENKDWSIKNNIIGTIVRKS